MSLTYLRRKGVSEPPQVRQLENSRGSQPPPFLPLHTQTVERELSHPRIKVGIFLAT